MVLSIINTDTSLKCYLGYFLYWNFFKLQILVNLLTPVFVVDDYC